MSEYTDKLVAATREQLIGEVLRLRGELSTATQRAREQEEEIEALREQTCARHAGQVHGAEAEELRAGIEKLIRSRRVSPGALCSLLDEIDARDSLAYLESRDEERGKLRSEVDVLKQESRERTSQRDAARAECERIRKLIADAAEFNERAARDWILSNYGTRKSGAAEALREVLREITALAHVAREQERKP